MSDETTWPGLARQIWGNFQRAGYKTPEELVAALWKDDFGYSTHWCTIANIGRLRWEETVNYLRERGYDLPPILGGVPVPQERTTADVIGDLKRHVTLALEMIRELERRREIEH